MSAVPTHVAPNPGNGSAWRNRLEQRPELPVLLVALLCWLVLLTAGASARHPDEQVAPAHSMHMHGVADHPGDASAAWYGAGLWIFMVIAMMLPLTTPSLRYVARMVPRKSRAAAQFAFVIAYLAVWAPGATLAAFVHTWPTGVPVLAGVCATAAAGVWELTPLKRRALLQGHRHQPVRALEPARTRSCLAFGFHRGTWCVASCGPAMVALTFLGHNAFVSVLMFIGLTLQQFTPDAHWYRKWSAAGLVGVSAISAVIM